MENKKPKLANFKNDLVNISEAICLFNSNPPSEVFTFLELKSELRDPVAELQAVLMRIGESKDPIAVAFDDYHVDGSPAECFSCMGDIAFSYAQTTKDKDVKSAFKRVAYLATGIAFLIDLREGEFVEKKN